MRGADDKEEEYIQPFQEVSLGKREEGIIAGRGCGLRQVFLFYLKRDLRVSKCKWEGFRFRQGLNIQGRGAM